MIANEDDALMSQYGIPNSVDTVDICESWDGNDYQYQAVAVGNSDNVPGLIDSVQTTQYQNGQVTGFTPSGNEATSPMSTGGSSFDFLYADNSTRQASIDYPYYGVSSPDAGACLHPPCPAMSVNSEGGRGVSIASKDVKVDSASRFHKHGLMRIGVRALVDNAEEISRSPEGNRRFRSAIGDQTQIWIIDPTSELLVGEETTGPSKKMVTKHEWEHVPGGFVRTRSQYEATEEVGGKTFVSRGTILFQKIHVQDSRFPPIGEASAVR